MKTVLEAIRAHWLERSTVATVRRTAGIGTEIIAMDASEVALLLAVAEAAAKAWPRMVSLFEFAALHGITEPDPDIVAFRAAIAPLMAEVEK